jgi:hypothetical protein
MKSVGAKLLVAVIAAITPALEMLIEYSVSEAADTSTMS